METYQPATASPQIAHTSGAGRTIPQVTASAHAMHNQRHLAAQQTGPQSRALHILVDASMSEKLPGKVNDNQKNSQPGDQSWNAQVDRDLQKQVVCMRDRLLRI